MHNELWGHFFRAIIWRRFNLHPEMAYNKQVMEQAISDLGPSVLIHV